MAVIAAQYHTFLSGAYPYRQLPSFCCRIILPNPFTMIPDDRSINTVSFSYILVFPSIYYQMKILFIENNYFLKKYFNSVFIISFVLDRKVVLP
jgi:hypothetical protein